MRLPHPFVRVLLGLGLFLLPFATLAQQTNSQTAVSLSFGQWCLVLAPLLLYALLLLWLGLSKITLKDALADKEQASKDAERLRKLQTTIIQQVYARPLVGNTGHDTPADVTAEYALRNKVVDRLLRPQLPTKPALEGDPDPDPTPKPPTSVSRLVVFMSGYTAISIGASLASFFIYHGIAYPAGTMPPFNALVNVLLALGIGTIPYTITKIAEAFRGEQS